MTIVAEIIEPGLLTTIQDAGRPGHRHLGIAQTGAADQLSMALVNAAIGNPVGAPVLECTLTGPTLRIIADTTLAISGADMALRINDQTAPDYTRIRVKSGDVISVTPAKTGARSYIAVAGGFAGEDFLASQSTYLSLGRGGYHGRALQPDDRLCAGARSISPPINIPGNVRPALSHDIILRACRGPETSLFDDIDLRKFFTAQHIAGRQSNRMGVKLAGLPLQRTSSFSMSSSPVFPGTVQCPDDGEPFILLADAQTTGGYPRVAQIVAADLNLAAQIAPGDRVWLQEVTPDQAREISRQKQELISLVLNGASFY